MNSEELVNAMTSLQKLEHHYKNQYEDYIAKALAAKENLERLEVLLQDLCSQLPLSPQQQESFLEFEPEPESINGSREQLELDWMGALVDDDTKPNPEPEQSNDKTETQEISHREFVKLSSQVMPILESIFALDPGKKLHLSYLHKAVNQQSQLGLSQNTVGLFLEEAIALGYCERDNYDKQCYYSISDPKTLLKEALRSNPYKRTFEKNTTEEKVEEKHQQNQQESITLTKPTHSLPPSPRVKMTLPDTIMGYIIERQPKTFTIQDVVNYLYSQTEQKQWSKTQNRQVTTSINNSLWGSKDQQWKRVQPGVYKPLLTPPQDNSISTTTQPTHNLPPILNAQVNILAMIDNYLAECKPKTFTARNILDYLYTKQEQKGWTKEQERKNLQAITGRLADYVNKKNWKRVRRGVYKPK